MTLTLTLIPTLTLAPTLMRNPDSDLNQTLTQTLILTLSHHYAEGAKPSCARGSEAPSGFAHLKKKKQISKQTNKQTKTKNTNINLDSNPNPNPNPSPNSDAKP